MVEDRSKPGAGRNRSSPPEMLPGGDTRRIRMLPGLQPASRDKDGNSRPSALRGPLGPPPSPIEGRVMSLVRGFWNAILSLIVGTMVGYSTHAFITSALETTVGNTSTGFRFSLGLAAWLVGGTVAFVMFVSYYLDDSDQ